MTELADEKYVSQNEKTNAIGIEQSKFEEFLRNKNNPLQINPQSYNKKI